MHHDPTFIHSRREFLRKCGMGLGGLAFASLLQRDLHGAPVSVNPLHPLAARRAPLPSKVKHVIHIFANGGPSHVDTFDRKTSLDKYHGQKLPGDYIATERKTGAAFRSPFTWKRYGKSGLEASELFAKTAAFADDLCVIRSMQANVPNHEPSLLLMNCGEARQVRPSLGSWVTYGLGTENENLPGFITLCPGGYPIQETQNWQCGFLPGVYQGNYVDSSKKTVEELIENIRNAGLSRPAQRKQLDLLARINASHQSLHPQDAALEARAQSFEMAYRMQLEATDAFDISREPISTRTMYGDTTQGRQFLIARRLVERGVRFVQLWHGSGQPWDAHDDLESNHRKLAHEADQPIAALLADLKRTGMLDSTLVIWGGEFGRTPTVELPTPGSNAGKINGRDHNHHGFTMWMAGGGVRGGTTYGETDEFGFKSVKDVVHVHDLHATIMKLLGFNHEEFTFRHAGRDYRLTDVHGKVVQALIA
ncbi:MAG: sulfatase [Opitutia bacterium Tous-C2FEB]|jgi:hypothetical protein|nr:MAG: sulfatase [Opitutae bacterium Tous-C2FEB]PAZ03075.1 MAG: sulfatase [Opitutae bacterium AMD-G3]